MAASGDGSGVMDSVTMIGSADPAWNAETTLTDIIRHDTEQVLALQARRLRTLGVEVEESGVLDIKGSVVIGQPVTEDLFHAIIAYAETAKDLDWPIEPKWEFDENRWEHFRVDTGHRLPEIEPAKRQVMSPSFGWTEHGISSAQIKIDLYAKFEDVIAPTPFDRGSGEPTVAEREEAYRHAVMGTHPDGDFVRRDLGQLLMGGKGEPVDIREITQRLNVGPMHRPGVTTKHEGPNRAARRRAAAKEKRS
jgi:hypothetical protein